MSQLGSEYLILSSGFRRNNYVNKQLCEQTITSVALARQK
jgi:hypothetical protein